jgi:hypothetical protein
MLILPKWLNKWLTPEEEAQLKDPSKRVFTFGLLASAATLALPAPGIGHNRQLHFGLNFSRVDGLWQPVAMTHEFCLAMKRAGFEPKPGPIHETYVWIDNLSKVTFQE